MTENIKNDKANDQSTSTNHQERVTPEREHLSTVGHKGGEGRTGKKSDGHAQNQDIADADDELSEGRNKVDESLKRIPT